MKITVEQELPCDLGTLRRFLEAATRLVSSDMTAYVSYVDESNKFLASNKYLRICSAKELEIDPNLPWGSRVRGL